MHSLVPHLVVTFQGQYAPMDPLHSLFIFNARFNPKDHQAQLERDERATFSRSRRSIERFDQTLNIETKSP